MKFVCIDMEADASVDIVIPPGEKLPFKDGSVDFREKIINNKFNLLLI
jgi:hypothetical protein